ncbi:MAG: glycosyltransferase family 9 protein [Myxococcota bacterium]|nr:glycosyltransferase family 9 protein [Myxococcota bacterium]
MSLRNIIDAVRASRQRPSSEDASISLEFDPHQDAVIIVYLFRGIGDAALLVPVLSAFKDRYPETRLGVIVSDLVAKTLALFELDVTLFQVPNEWFENTEALTKSQRSQMSRLEAKTKKNIKSAGFTVGIELTGNGSVPASDWLDDLQLRYTIGWAPNTFSLDVPTTRQYFRFDHSVNDIRFQADRHWSFALCQAFSIFGLDGPDLSIRIPVSKRACNWAENQWGDGFRILIFPGSRDSKKRWNPNRFSTIVNKLLRTHEVSTIVSGAPKEAALVDQVRRGINDSTCRYTGRNLGRLLALIQTASIVITNDTGPMHLSYLSGVPTVAVYKYMSPIVWGPIQPKREFLIIETHHRSDDEISTQILRFIRQRLRRARFAQFKRKNV